MNDASYLIDRFQHRPTKRRTISIPEYAETTIIPTGKYRGMLFKNNRAPYLIEPLFCMSPQSPIQEVRCMFPAQTGKSTIGELCTMYYIVEHPSEILYVSSNETAAMRWMMRRIEPRAHAAGIEFRSQSDSKNTRRTGDTAYSKEFDGGNIDIASALSTAQLASETKRIVIADETDRWRIQLGEEGLTWDIMYARTQAWGDERKIIAISTPTTEDASVIYQLYSEGDQRLYWVPCPLCGEFQLLDYAHGRGYGLQWMYKGGKISRKSCVYVCQKCAKEIVESKKPGMLNAGEWRKSALPINDFIASFHINGIYSPFLRWYDMACAWDDAKNNPTKQQTLQNLKMGLPFKESGTRPKVGKLIENRGKYKSGEVPDGVLYLTAGMDVQRGSEADPNNPARLEFEILGIGAGYRTWSILYKRIEGNIGDPYSGAWEELHQWALENKLTFYRSDGFGFPVSLFFIDSGSGGEEMDIIYRFCSRWQNTFPIKGFQSLKRRKTEKGDEMTEGNFRRYRAAKMAEGVTLYEISTNYYKTQIYNNLKISRQEIEPQRPGFCDFPSDYGERYFEMLTAEERHRDGSFHAGGRRNEALDCRVYALCAADVFLDSLLLDFRSYAKQNGARQDQIQQITHVTVIDDMKRQTIRKKI